MVNGKYNSLSKLLWEILANPLLEGLDIDDAAMYAINTLKLIGAPLLYKHEVKTLKVEDYRAHLPINLLDVKGINYCDRPLRYATDTFHQSNHDRAVEETYTLNNCVITTSFEKGEIEVAYTTLALDDEGYPMIPDNISVEQAIKYSIRVSYLEAFWEMGKISDKVFQRLEQQRDWYIGQAQSNTLLQGADHLESIVNSVNRLISNNHAYDNNFRGAGMKERIKRY